VKTFSRTLKLGPAYTRVVAVGVTSRLRNVDRPSMSVVSPSTRNEIQ
jgi:hypothetical protein